jgi:hypothetical protein
MSYKLYLCHACRLQDIEDEATLTAESESDSDDEIFMDDHDAHITSLTGHNSMQDSLSM